MTAFPNFSRDLKEAAQAAEIPLSQVQGKRALNESFALWADRSVPDCRHRGQSRRRGENRQSAAVWWQWPDRLTVYSRTTDRFGSLHIRHTAQASAQFSAESRDCSCCLFYCRKNLGHRRNIEAGIGWSLSKIGKRGLVFTTDGEHPISGFSKFKRGFDAAMLACARMIATPTWSADLARPAPHSTLAHVPVLHSERSRRALFGPCHRRRARRLRHVRISR